MVNPEGRSGLVERVTVEVVDHLVGLSKVVGRTWLRLEWSGVMKVIPKGEGKTERGRGREGREGGGLIRLLTTLSTLFYFISYLLDLMLVQTGWCDDANQQENFLRRVPPKNKFYFDCFRGSFRGLSLSLSRPF